GGEEDENLVLWDGFTLYHLDHFFGVFSTLNPAVIQDINLMNGPFSSRYGARSGGVLEVNGRSGNKLHPRTLIDADLIDVGLLTEGPIGEKTSYLVSFRRSHTDFIRTGFYDELLDRLFSQSVSADPESLVNEEVESDYFYDDLNIKLSHEIGEKDRLSFSLFNGGDSFERNSLYTYETQGSPFQYNDIFDDDSEWGNTGLGLTWTRNASPDKQLYTSLGYSKYSSRYEFSDTQRDFFNGIPIPEKTMTDIDENSVEDITFHHQQTHSMKSNGTLEFGYQFTLLDVENRFLENSSSNNSEVQADTSNVSIQNSLYAERRLAYGENWKLRLGGRLSTNSFNEKLYFEPRLRVDHMISPQWNLHFATGYYIQQIRRVAEQNLFLRQSDRWALSDGDSIPISKSFHSSFGLSWSSSPLTISAEVFYKDLKGVILNQEQNRLLSAFTAENEGISSGDGMVAGLDLLTTYAKGSHSAWLAYSYSFSANSLEDVNDGEEFPSAFNKPHDLKLVYNYRMRDYTVHSQLTASSGYPFTPLLGFFEGPGGDTFLVYGDDLSGRLPSQFRWDMSVSRSFTYKSSTLSLGLGVFNLTDHQNIKNRTYSINQVRDEAPEELKISTIDLELIGISPTFSISLDFR
ncbi:MAG: hypothetical protein HKN45_03145, partial [Flavobacteriales bacterium]|nr:hypothetical protein [Flavobacteriales bacterium]